MRARAHGAGVQQLIDTLDTDPWQRALHMRLPEPFRAGRDTSITDLSASVFSGNIARAVAGADPQHLSDVARSEKQ
eukprot:1687277-Pyramimonas_sp.AAC.1